MSWGGASPRTLVPATARAWFASAEAVRVGVGLLPRWNQRRAPAGAGGSEAGAVLEGGVGVSKAPSSSALCAQEVLEPDVNLDAKEETAGTPAMALPVDP